MAKIHILKKIIEGVKTAFYPLTIPQAVIDPTSGKSARAELDEKANHGYESNPKTLKSVDDAKADHGYDVEETQKTLKEVDTLATQNAEDITQLAGDVNELGIKDAVQGAKIKDIENVLSTANLGQSAQLSVSGRKIVSLPKNSANGGMSVKLEGLTAENIVVNGNFANGITGWTILTSTLTHLDTAIRLAITSTEGRLFVQRSLPVGIYYVRMRVRSIGDIAPSYIMLGYMTTATQNIGQITNPVKDQWYDMSYVSSIGGEVTRFPQIVFNNAGAVIEIDKSIGITAINLGDAFGVGNEPTKEQCDIIFSDYFEGVKSFEPTGRVRSVDKNGINPTALYLTAPELRSNGAVKDEIRKGANGYEFVKRVGVGTLGAELITNAADREFSSDTGFWTKTAGIATISGGVCSIPSTTGSNQGIARSFLTTGKLYRIEFDIVSISSSSIRVMLGGATALYGTKVGRNTFYGVCEGDGILRIYSSVEGQSFVLDNISVKEVLSAEGLQTGTVFTEYGTYVHYTLATPVISPVNYGGILNSAENGTVYHEPVIADAGVYGTNMPILLTDYPIASIEEIIKHENGVDTYLNVANAVIAGDKLSFTHPSLANGDLVLFTYSFAKESTNGNITATFYDSNVVKIDTVTGKAYKINELVTNGVLTRTLTEV